MRLKVLANLHIHREISFATPESIQKHRRILIDLPCTCERRRTPGPWGWAPYSDFENDTLYLSYWCFVGAKVRLTSPAVRSA